jgi:hypothetical protein
MITHPMRAPIDLDQSTGRKFASAGQGSSRQPGQSLPSGVAAAPGALI